MTNKTMPETTYRQFPMRLEASLADALDRYSEATNIPKTTISRIALTKFLNELEKSGARAMIQQVCKF
jgi:predicted DNA-binding protein